MTTKELVQWAFNAEAKREESWQPRKNGYAMTMKEAIVATMPIGAIDVEAEIVECWLYTSWNEVQDWQNAAW